MNVRLKALLGTAEAGQAATRWIINFAENNPVKTIQEMEEMFKGLVNAGIKPTTEAMQGLVGATVKYGLSGQDLGRLTKALRQVGAMTNTQKQEMNQLSEQIPLFMREVAKAMNTSQDQLLEDIKNRKVDSAKTINTVMMILSKGSAEAIADFNKTWEGGLARLSIAWTKLLQELGATVFFEDMKSGLDRITNFVKENTDLIKDAFGETWRRVADTFQTVFSGLFDATAGDLFTVVEMFGALVKGIGTFGLGLLQVGKIAVKVIGGMAQIVNGILKAITMAKSPSLAIRSKDELTRDLKALQDEAQSYVEGRSDAYIERLKKQNKTFISLLERIEETKAALGTGIPIDINIDFDGQIQAFKEAQSQLAEDHKSSLERIAELRKTYADKMTNDELSKLFGEGVNNSAQNKKDEDLIGKQVEKNLNNLTVDQPQNFSTGWKKALEDIKEKAKESFGEMADLGEYMGRNITDALSSGFETLFQQLKEGVLDVKSIMMSVLDEIYKAMARILAQRMAMGIVMQVGSLIAGGVASSGSGTGASADTGLASNDSFMSNAALRKPSVSSQGMQKVEIINNSGEQLQVTQARSKSENGDTIMSIVLDSINRNKNGSRSMLKAMMA